MGERKPRRTRKDGKLRKKASFSSYKSYIQKLLKHQDKSMQITSRGMGVVDAFTKDIFQRIAEEAGKATRFSGATTLRTGAIIAAVKMHLPADMATHALSNAVSAVGKYSKKK